MNTLKAVLKHLNKEENVELSSEKVELGLIDDLKNQMKSANKDALNAIDLANKAKGLAEKSLKLNNDLEKNFEEVLKKVKDLGISSAEIEVKKQLDQVKTNIKEIEKTLKGLDMAT